MNTKQPYLGFTFAGHHSSEFGLTVVSDGSRYHQSISNGFTDSTVSVPGKSGSYYFGTQMNEKDFTIQTVFDSLTTQMRNKIQNWLYPTKTGWLIYDEMPYKKYFVKVSSVPNFDFLPFENNYKRGDFSFEQDIFKGEMEINFYSFYEYAEFNEKFDLPREITSNKEVKWWMLESGLIPSNYTHTNILMPNENASISRNTIFSIYNAGNGIASAQFHFTVLKPTNDNISTNSFPLQITNLENGETAVIQDVTELFTTDVMINNNSIDNIIKWEFSIMGPKKEIWVYGLNNNNERITTKINAGSAFNHYYPKILHVKPLEIAVAGQTTITQYFIEYVEPLIYPLLYDSYEDFAASTSSVDGHRFEGFLESLSSYTMCTKNRSYEVNSLLNPAQLFVDMDSVDVELMEPNSLIYFIKSNDFITNISLMNFTPVYTHTYI